MKNDGDGRILVTGGAGYIGSHVAKELGRRGYEPVILDNLSEGHREAVAGFELVEGDLSDERALTAVFARYPISCVLHFAANCYVGESVGAPGKYYRNNVANTLNLVDAMLRARVRRLVFSSTAATYGEPRTIPIAEDHPQEPVSPYGRSKLMAERILADMEVAHGLRFVSLRYFNAAGTDPEGELGEDHNPETHLIPLILRVASGVREAVEIYGTDYDTRDGTCVRDFIHVVDLADAHILALEALIRGGESRTYNLGTGSGYTVREVIEAARRVTGHPIPVKEVARRPGDTATLVASSRRITEELGWRPRLGSLEAILQTAWAWHSRHPRGYES